MNPPANWYPDPTGRHGQRYWDGETWTEHVFTDGVQGVDPLESPDADDDETEGTADATAPADGGAGAAAPGLFVDAGGAQTSAAGPTSQAYDAEGDTDRWSPDGSPDGDAGTPAGAEDHAASDVPIAAGGTTGAGDTAEGADGTHGPDARQSPDEWHGPDGTDGRDGAEGGDGAVAPEVEADDVVATLDEVTEASDPPPMASADMSDAFVLAPETVSRLVRRQGSTEPAAPSDGAAPDAADADDTGSPTGAIDAPPPVVDASPPDRDAGPPVVDAPPPTAAMASPPVDAPAPTAASGPGGLGISGELVGGAFAEREQAGPVALQNTRLLRCAVGGGSGVIARQGTMVAYQGDVSFERQGAGGVTRALKRAATGEGLAMMRVEGSGDVFFADGAQHVFLLHLDGGPGLSVNGRNVLAFSSSLQWDIERVKGATLLAGGLFNTTLTGSGWVALVSDGEPVVLRTDEAPTYVDVNALVAWSAGLSTRVVNTVSAKSLVGLGSGEAFQMAFDGAGLVIVQPSEGVTAVTTSS